MLSADEITEVNVLLPTSPSSGSNTLPAAWCVLELVRSCSSHPKLAHIQDDRELMSKLLIALESEQASDLCAYVALQLSKDTPDCLASFLKSSDNARFFVMLCQGHASSEDVIELVGECSKGRVFRHEAVKQFLLQLQRSICDAVQPSSGCMQLLCAMVASRNLPTRSNDEMLRLLQKGLADTDSQPEPKLLAATADLCYSDKVRTPQLESLLVHTLRCSEQLILANGDDKALLLDSIKLCEVYLRQLQKRVIHERSLQLPELLLRICLLAGKSTRYVDAEPRTEEDNLRCRAARLLAESCNAQYPIWLISEVRQSGIFETPQWMQTVQKLRSLQFRRQNAWRPQPDLNIHGKAILCIDGAIRPKPPQLNTSGGDGGGRGGDRGGRGGGGGGGDRGGAGDDFEALQVAMLTGPSAAPNGTVSPLPGTANPSRSHHPETPPGLVATGAEKKGVQAGQSGQGAGAPAREPQAIATRPTAPTSARRGSRRTTWNDAAAAVIEIASSLFRWR